MIIFKIIQSWFRAIKLWTKRLDIEFTAEITATNNITGERTKFIGKSNIEEVALWKARRKANKHAKKAR